MIPTPHFFKAAARHMLLKKRADLLRNEMTQAFAEPITSPIMQWFKNLFIRDEKALAPEPQLENEGAEPATLVMPVPPLLQEKHQ